MLRYQLNDIRALDVGNGFFLAYCPGGEARIIPAEAIEVLGRCPNLASLEDHSIRLCQGAAGVRELQPPTSQKPRRSLLGKLLGGDNRESESAPTAAFQNRG